jgi:HAD superfamily hydrolase (TIGR01509 family)
LSSDEPAARYDRVMASVMAVVFDFDGVILDSETPEFESHRLIYERCGIALTPDEWVDQIGIWVEGHGQRWFRRLCDLSAGAPDYETFEAEKRRLFQELVAAEPMRGILDLLDALDGAGIPAAIASSASSRWVLSAAERVGVRDRFSTIVTADDVDRRKPAPDVYLEALRRLGAKPERSIAIEDSAPGIAAARAAGMKTVAIPHWLTERHDLSAADLRVLHAGDLTLARLDALAGES